MTDGDRRDQLLRVVEILASLIRNIALKRALHRANDSPHLTFWRLIHGNQLDVPVLEWCKLFGSDDAERQPIHWKNVATEQEAFRTRLLAELGVDVGRWVAYWDEMKKYRDMHVAHHDLRRDSIGFYPELDLALNSAFFYFDYVRAELRKFRIDQQPSDIRKYAHDFEEQCFDFATAGMAATAHIKQTII